MRDNTKTTEVINRTAIDKEWVVKAGLDERHTRMEQRRENTIFEQADDQSGRKDTQGVSHYQGPRNIEDGNKGLM